MRKKKKKKSFDGYYFKHQKEGATVALIPGVSADGAFLQVITNDKSYYFTFPSMMIEKNCIQTEGCTFSRQGVRIHLPNISGRIDYGPLSPLKYDIMGVFRFLPLECRHGIISMRHSLSGTITVDGRRFDFNGGAGYIEKDSGTSFPKRYIWLQCNDFDDGSSIMAAIADIPFAGRTFQGCICAVLHNGREYRFATYRGVRIHYIGNRIILLQGRLCLKIEYETEGHGHPLSAPIMGRMDNTIYENNSVRATFSLYEGNRIIFKKTSRNVSFERFPMLGSGQ